MKVILLLFLIFYSSFTHSQSIDWKNSKNWKLYNLYRNDAFKYPIDSLTNYKYVNLDDEVILTLLEGVKLFPDNLKNVYWMGLYVATYEIGDVTRKVEISMYGGFFYDDFTKKYFQIETDKKQRWLNYFSNIVLK
jgi:hypothetical protein